MDDLKFKILDFIHLRGSNAEIPIVGQPTDFNRLLSEITEDDRKGIGKTALVDPGESSLDQPSDQEILETVDETYFSTKPDFLAGRYAIESLNDVTDLPLIESHLKILKQQQAVVSKQVYQMIVEKQAAFNEECNRIIDILPGIHDLLGNVREARDRLGEATTRFTTASLGILSSYRKRTLVLQLIKDLRAIKSLHQTESKMNELLSSGDFPGAIELTREFNEKATIYRHFKCVEALTTKSKDAQIMMEERLDVALAKICYNFNESIYEQLQSAYLRSGKTSMAMDQLHMHFASAVNNTAYDIVRSYIPANEALMSSKIRYPNLCNEVPDHEFIDCLLTLCKALWRLVLSYHQVVNWHQQNSLDDAADFQSSFNQQYVKEKLSTGKTRLWHDVQTRVSSLVLAAKLSTYKIDDFLEVLSILHRMSQIGEEFCDSDSEELSKSVRTQSTNYFNKFHTSKMDDLRVILENEPWTLCPVRSDFSLTQLQEFRGLRGCVELCAGVSQSRPSSSLDSSSVDANLFSKYSDPDSSTPFDNANQSVGRDEDILTSTTGDDPSGYFSEESEEEVDISSVKVETGKSRKNIQDKCNNGPFLTNTSLTVLRLCGKYLQMSRLLKAITTEVVLALTHLFQYYLFVTFNFFASDIPNSLCPNVTTLKLSSVLNRIKETLFHTISPDTEIYEATMSPHVDLTNPLTLYGLNERIIAVESLLFLAQEFILLKSYLEQLLQSVGYQTHVLQQFYSQTVSVCHEIRKPVYAGVSWRAIDVRTALSMMSDVDWEIQELQSDASKYVDFLFEECARFKMKVDETTSTITFPDSTSDVLWDNIILLISHIFVEGFASAKKCSDTGRALMHSDFVHFKMKVKPICSLQPLPHEDFVVSYIQAFYRRPEDLENWIKEHTEYTVKQLTSLVTCACKTNKKLQRKLIATIEELEKSGTR